MPGACYSRYIEANMLSEAGNEAESFLPVIASPLHQQQQQRDDALGLDTGTHSGFSWDKPLPPAPGIGAAHSNRGRESHRHHPLSKSYHCEYSRLVHKGMHHFYFGEYRALHASSLSAWASSWLMCCTDSAKVGSCAALTVLKLAHTMH